MVPGAESYLMLAETALKSKSLEDFMRYIGAAEALAVDTGVMAKVFYLRAKGLYFLGRNDMACLAVDEALKFQHTEEYRIRLGKFKACALTNKGCYKESMRILKELTTITSNDYLLSEIYLNMGWTLLDSYKSNLDKAILEEAKLYLDTAYTSIENFENTEKKRIALTNYSEYFKLTGDIEMAIEMLEEAEEYCQESKRAKLYNDLAELYLMRNEEGDSEKVSEYLHESEVLAQKFDDDYEIAMSLYLKGLLKMDSSDFVQVLDCMYIAYTNFINVGAIKYAIECYNKIIQVTNSLNCEFVITMKNRLARMMQEAASTELI